MYGAIIGDIAGSRFEFDRGGWTKDFDLFTEECTFTDDTVMSIAVAEALINAGPEAAVEKIKEKCIESMQAWGHRYPDAGYGGRFYGWLFGGRNPKPYGSFGNGSAMRVSAAGRLYDSLERTREVARATAEVTHNHPEGIKGAECTAAVMYLARTGVAKEEIAEYVIKEFGYDFSMSLDEMRKRHRHDETCQDSLPKALRAFMDGTSYEDVIRNAISLGGDTDTLGAIAGAMGEAMYGVPVGFVADMARFLPKDILDMVNTFNSVLSRSNIDENGIEDLYGENRFIAMMVDEFKQNNDQDTLLKLLNVLIFRIMNDGQAPMPMVDVSHVTEKLDLNKVNINEPFSFDENIRLQMDTMRDQDCEEWIPLFTSQEELEKGDTANIIMNIDIYDILRNGLTNDRVSGIVINPFGNSLTLGRNALQLVIDHVDSQRKENEE